LQTFKSVMQTQKPSSRKPKQIIGSVGNCHTNTNERMG
jgi:hypothetical protein